MGTRPTVADVAGKAGVSVATVDRVLNGRHKVREETARKVYEAANAIGYHGAPLIRQRMTADLPQMNFGFVLQRADQHFYRSFGEMLVKAVENARGVRGRAHLRFVESQTPDEVVAALASLGPRVDAIALTSLDHHSVTKAVRGLHEQGKPVFSLLSDFAQGIRESYIGLNNMKVGRSAGWLISRTAPHPGKVALFVGSHRWHGHELRETGFRSFFREHAPQFEVLETLVNMETTAVTHESMISLLRRHRDLAGIYVAGGGMEGAISALREEGPKPLPAVIVNELTPESGAALAGISAHRRYSDAVAAHVPGTCRSDDAVGFQRHVGDAGTAFPAVRSAYSGEPVAHVPRVDVTKFRIGRTQFYQP